MYKLETTSSAQTPSEDGRSESTLVDEDQDNTGITTTTTLMKVCATFQLSGLNFTTCAVNGLVVIGLPAITHELKIDDSLAVWPSSVTSLSTAATLLLAGTIADLVGARGIELFGAFACGLLMLGAGASRTGMEMVGIRAVQGIALSCHLAASVALITQCIPRGRGRNIAFACLGLSQPLGFSFGLVLGGILVDTIGWRGGWYIYGGITLALAVMGWFVLPMQKKGRGKRAVMRQLREEIDWVGTLLISGFMGVISAFMA
jgi:MFS family permease